MKDDVEMNKDSENKKGEQTDYRNMQEVKSNHIQCLSYVEVQGQE